MFIFPLKNLARKGFNTILKGFVVTVREGMCEQEAPNQDGGLDVLLAGVRVHCDSRTW